MQYLASGLLHQGSQAYSRMNGTHKEEAYTVAQAAERLRGGLC